MSIDELADYDFCAHSRQVAEISALLAESAGYSQEEIVIIKQAALFHDLGKGDIPAQILNKSGALTPEEYELVKTHTTLGYDKIIKVIDALSAAAVVCRDHHECPDGSGYGSGVKDEGIHPYSNIVAAADVFDALYSERPYKEPWDTGKIKEFFQTRSGTQFDAEVVKLLLSNIENIKCLYKRQESDFIGR